MRNILSIYGIVIISTLFCSTKVSALEENCLSCHEKLSPMVVEQWRDSVHGKEDVGCIMCHDPGLLFTRLTITRRGLFM